MSGLTAGLFSIAGLIVGVTLFRVAVTNASGTSKIIQDTSSGFSNVLLAASGSTTSYAQY